MKININNEIVRHVDRNSIYFSSSIRYVICVKEHSKSKRHTFKLSSRIRVK